MITVTIKWFLTWKPRTLILLTLFSLIWGKSTIFIRFDFLKLLMYSYLERPLWSLSLRDSRLKTTSSNKSAPSLSECLNTRFKNLIFISSKAQFTLLSDSFSLSPTIPLNLPFVSCFHYYLFFYYTSSDWAILFLVFI